MLDLYCAQIVIYGRWIFSFKTNMEHLFLKDSHFQTCYFRANEAMELEPKQMESLYFCSRIVLIIVLLLVH